jgi:signal peptidase I
MHASSWSKDKSLLKSRGQIVVFKDVLTDEFFVARLVGLPGEQVKLTDGKLSINGTHVIQQKVDDHLETKEVKGPNKSMPICNNEPVAMGGECVKEQLKETLPNGVSYNILNVRNSSLDNTPVYNIPAGHVFVLGDNRDNSSDSRLPPKIGGRGFIPIENIKWFVPAEN